MKHEANAYDTAILGALQGLRHIYAGTVPFKTVQERRTKNRIAKRSRKINRG